MKLAEANAWFHRNRDKLGLEDPVSAMIESVGLEPVNVLEIGCANGWRLAKLCQKYDLHGTGIDASSDAIVDGKQRFPEANMDIWYGMFPDFKLAPSFELIICGFFLYLAEREDLFRIVVEADRLLADRGYLIIHDFYSAESYSNPYVHDPDMRCYKQDYSRLFTGNPAYRVVSVSMTGTGDDVAAVHLLQKKMRGAWPCRSK